jgi:transposase
MSAIKTRASIHYAHHYYLTPLSRIGTVPEQLEGWIDQAQKGSLKSVKITRPLENGKQKFLGTGYELERKQETILNGEIQTWTERVFLIRSQSYTETQIRGLHQRLNTAQEKLFALTPPVGRGKRQVREEEELCQKAEEILRHHRVEGLLGYGYDYEVPTRRRAGRYQITAVTCNQSAIEEVEKRFGWRAYVTNAPKKRLSVSQGLLTYRDEWIVERSFHRLKGVALSLSPFFVQRDDQVQGLVHLLSLAVRLLTLIEFVVRTRLQASGESLVGLYRGSPRRSTRRPTAEKILEAFENVTVTLFEIRGNAYAHVSELNAVQQQIIRCLGLTPDIYSGLVDSS